MKKFLPWWTNFALAILGSIMLAFSFWVKPGVAPVAQTILLIDIMIEMFIVGYVLHKHITKEDKK